MGRVKGEKGATRVDTRENKRMEKKCECVREREEGPGGEKERKRKDGRD